MVRQEHQPREICPIFSCPCSRVAGLWHLLSALRRPLSCLSWAVASLRLPTTGSALASLICSRGSGSASSVIAELLGLAASLGSCHSGAQWDLPAPRGADSQHALQSHRCLGMGPYQPAGLGALFGVFPLPAHIPRGHSCDNTCLGKPPSTKICSCSVTADQTPAGASQHTALGALGVVWVLFPWGVGPLASASFS